MLNSADPDQFASKIRWQINMIYTVCKGSVYMGSAGLGLNVAGWVTVIVIPDQVVIVLYFLIYVPPPTGRGTNWFCADPVGIYVGFGVSVMLSLAFALE